MKGPRYFRLASVAYLPWHIGVFLLYQLKTPSRTGLNQRKTIVNSWVRCLENNQLVITSGFPTVNFRK